MTCWSARWWCMGLSLLGTAVVRAAEPAQKPVTYDDVRPVFRQRCVSCHNAERPRGDLDLSTFAAIKVGSTSGPVAVSTKADESLLYTAVTHLEEPFMPPNSPKIPQREIDLIRRWIDGGLRERADPGGKTTDPRPQPAPVIAAATKPVPATLVTPVAAIPRRTAVTALAASPVAPLAAVSGHRQSVLFSLTDFKPVKAFEFPEGEVFVQKFSSDGELLLVGGGIGGLSGKVIGIETATGRRVFDLGNETDAVLAADISADKRLVAFGGPGRVVKLFRTDDGQQIATLRKHTDWILSVAFSPDGLLVASSDRFGSIQVWEAETGAEFFTLRGHVGPVNALAWAADSQRLVSAGQDGTVRWWNLHRGTQQASWDCHPGGVLALGLLPGEQVLCGGRDKQLSVRSGGDAARWDVTLSDQVVELAATGDGRVAVAGDARGNVSVVSLADGKLLGRLEIPVDPTLARKPVAVARATPKPVARRSVSPELAAAETAAQQLSDDLAATKKAHAAAEAALAQARETATQLQAIIVRQEEAARQAAQRVETLHAQSGPSK
ncbi:MAG TPA: c-type cytochrome domain-containing protein [Planctomycetaceae bacterium]|nr:c-type cytochrome domain-containing protein [Planctomycetaceae bacterium]